MFQRIAFLKKYSELFGRHCWWQPGFSKVTCNMWGPFKKRHSYNLQSPQVFYNKYVRYFTAPIFRTIPGKFVRILSFTFIAKKDIWEVSRDSYHSYKFTNIKSNHQGVLLWVKVTLLCEYFSRLLNCTNGTKPPKVSHMHCVKSVQKRSYFWSVFSCIRTQNGKIRTRNNSVFGHFSRTYSSIKAKYSAY